MFVARRAKVVLVVNVAVVQPTCWIYSIKLQSGPYECVPASSQGISATKIIWSIASRSRCCWYTAKHA